MEEGDTSQAGDRADKRGLALAVIATVLSREFSITVIATVVFLGFCGVIQPPLHPQEVHFRRETRRVEKGDAREAGDRADHLFVNLIRRTPSTSLQYRLRIIHIRVIQEIPLYSTMWVGRGDRKRGGTQCDRADGRRHM